MRNPATLLPALIGRDADPELQALTQHATSEQINALAEALGSAYEKGREDADTQAAALVARILNAMLGVPSVSTAASDGVERGTMRRAGLRQVLKLIRPDQ